jgi:ABC-2 type transport system ATP-binding protein
LLVETRSLSKSYGTLTALDGCTLDVVAGEVFGLLGENGAGKTTLLRLLLGFLRPTRGSARIGGFDVHRHSVRVRAMTSYLPGEVRLFGQMRGHELLRFLSEVRPDGDETRARQYAERLELDLSRRVAFMSTGMRQKLALAAAFAPHTRLLILDEPTTSLDPNMRTAVLEMVREARQQDRTVFFSSHVLSEVDEVCDRVAIIRAGRLVQVQVMSELRKRHRIHAVLEGPLTPAPETLASHFSVSSDDGERLVLDTHGELAPLLGWLATLPLRDIRIEPAGLRSVYQRYHAGGKEDGERVAGNG